MNAIKKSALAAAVLMSMGVGAAQAATNVFSFTGAFVMFSGYDPTFSNPSEIVDNGDTPGDPALGDPISGFMYLDTVTVAGTATMIPGATFFGEAWSATGITLQATMNPGEVLFSMNFNWGAPDAGPGSTSYAGGIDNGLGSGTCGVANCDIGVTGAFQLSNTLSFVTTQSNMPAGPFAGFQPTFNGQATFVGTVPEASTYGMMLAGLGLVGFAARRRQQKSLAA